MLFRSGLEPTDADSFLEHLSSLIEVLSQTRRPPAYVAPAPYSGGKMQYDEDATAPLLDDDK